MPRRELEKIYDAHGGRLFTCALAVTRCRDLAEDAVSEAFCRLLRLKHTPQHLKAYVFRSVRNAAIDLMRKHPDTVELFEDSVFDLSDSPRETAEKRQFQERVEKALETLSEDEREVIVQHLYADLTFQEIADLRDRPLATVTSWYRRGLAKLRTCLEEPS